MAQFNDVSTLDGNFKVRYAPKLINAVPECAKLQKRIEFKSAEKLGKTYNFPVCLSQEGGITYLGPGDGVVTLNDSIALTLQEASVDAAQIIARGAFDYESAAKAMSSEAAFENTVGLVGKNLAESARKRLELALLYGRSGLATTASSTNSDATTTDVTFTAATWAVGIWSGVENHQFNFYDNGVLVSTGADAIFTMTRLTPSTRVVRFTGTSTGITALDSAISSDPTQVKVYFRGAFGKEMVGLDQIIQNTGTLFGISATTYSLWRSNDLTTTGQLTMKKIQNGIAEAVGRGLDESVVCYVNPKTWENLNTDLAALRMFDSSYKSSDGENGYEGITYHCQSGKVEVESHLFVKEGDCFIFPVSALARIGSLDLTFERPGGGGKMLFDREDQNAIEMRAYTNQSLVSPTPAKLLKISGFTNT